ncbi:acid-sensing ion channel 4-B-like isoform X1 [Parasteatoda tepidariorum]|uniref:acid-sensing ion channel 4-B-like isoform X1 n=1 Tax=Parasteatoda tepidariorum TaxID=114398 RepID=UPI0039BCB7CE
MMGHKREDFILSCYFEGKPCLDRIGQFFHHDYTNCYTVNGYWGYKNSSYLNGSMFQPRSGRPSELSLLLNLEHDEYTRELDRTVRAKMTIHSPNTIPNPEYDGVSLYPGFSYNYGIKEFIVRVLPFPYKTNCKNYAELKEKRTGATLTQEDCLAECTARLHKEYCNCTVRRLSHIHDIPCCLDTERHCLDLFDSPVKDVCYSKCRMPCTKTTYNYEAVDHSEYHRGDCYNDWLDETKTEEDSSYFRKNYICLRVFYVTADSEIYTHKPMYDGIQVFSVIGGYIGLWLGVSLLDIFGHLLHFAFTCFLKKKSSNRIKNNSSQLYRHEKLKIANIR